MHDEIDHAAQIAADHKRNMDRAGIVHQIRGGYVQPIMEAHPIGTGDELARMRADVHRLTADRDAAKAGAVRVKPLVWETGVHGATYADDGFGGTWWVTHCDGRSTARRDAGGGCVETIGMDVSTDAMQKFIENLREARILATLEPSPVSDKALIRTAGLKN